MPIQSTGRVVSEKADEVGLGIHVKQSLYLTSWPHHSLSGQSLASHRGGPGSIPGLVKWDLWWKKWCWGTFSPITSVSPANLHSTE
jgi:hypothetical protein